MVRTLLLHASLPPSFWVFALHTAIYLLNILPHTNLKYSPPTTILFHKTPIYDHLRTFGCLCYPNLSATTLHKLSPRSSACVFLGYPLLHRGYLCMDVSTRQNLLSPIMLPLVKVSSLSQRPLSSPLILMTFSITLKHLLLSQIHSPITILFPLELPKLRHIVPLSPYRYPLPFASPLLPSTSPPSLPTHTTSTSQNTAPHVPLVLPSHPMQTRAKNGIFKPRIPCSMLTQSSSPSPVPKTYC